MFSFLGVRKRTLNIDGVTEEGCSKLFVALRQVKEHLPAMSPFRPPPDLLKLSPTILKVGTADVPSGAVTYPSPNEYPFEPRLSNHPPKRTAAGSSRNQTHGAEAGDARPATFGGLRGRP